MTVLISHLRFQCIYSPHYGYIREQSHASPVSEAAPWSDATQPLATYSGGGLSHVRDRFLYTVVLMWGSVSMETCVCVRDLVVFCTLYVCVSIGMNVAGVSKHDWYCSTYHNRKSNHSNRHSVHSRLREGGIRGLRGVAVPKTRE